MNIFMLCFQWQCKQCYVVVGNLLILLHYPNFDVVSQELLSAEKRGD